MHVADRGAVAERSDPDSPEGVRNGVRMGPPLRVRRRFGKFDLGGVRFILRREIVCK